jgi:hypothetical protein
MLRRQGAHRGDPFGGDAAEPKHRQASVRGPRASARRPEPVVARFARRRPDRRQQREVRACGGCGGEFLGVVAGHAKASPASERQPRCRRRQAAMPHLHAVTAAGSGDVDAIVDEQLAAHCAQQRLQFERHRRQLPHRPRRFAQLHRAHATGYRGADDATQPRDVADAVGHEQQARRRQRREDRLHAAS